MWAGRAQGRLGERSIRVWWASCSNLQPGGVKVSSQRGKSRVAATKLGYVRSWRLGAGPGGSNVGGEVLVLPTYAFGELALHM